jgi:hypothetical protein
MTDDLLALHQGKIMTDNRAEQLIFGPGGIMEMKQTIADKEKRIEQLETIIEWSGMPYPEEK